MPYAFKGLIMKVNKVKESADFQEIPISTNTNKIIPIYELRFRGRLLAFVV